MALVGVIQPGTIAGMFRAVKKARGDAMLLVDRDEQFGHVVFEGGEMVDVRLGTLEGSDAARALERWSSGIYTLIKRGHKTTTHRGHVLVVGLDDKARKSTEDCLEAHEFETSVVPYHKQVVHVARFIRPDAIVMAPPRGASDPTLEEICANLDEALDRQPSLAVVGPTNGHALPDCVTVIDLSSLPSFVEGLGPSSGDWAIPDDDALDGPPGYDTAKLLAVDTAETLAGDALSGHPAPAVASGAAPPRGTLTVPLLVLVFGSIAIWAIFIALRG